MKKNKADSNDKLRKKYESAKSGNFTSYSSMIANEFGNRVNQLSQLLCGTHELSTGTYKENLLKEYLIKFLPKRYSVGTGFVMFGEESKHISKQLDLIVYDEINYPVVFKDSDFVILRPESVRAVIEVKGFLNNKMINSFMDLIIDFSKKWQKYMHDFSPFFETDDIYISPPGLFVMAWDIAVDTKGKLQSDGKRLRNSILRKYKKAFTLEDIDIHLPVLCGAYIYSKYCVHLTHMSTNRECSVGYGTSAGSIPDSDSGENIEKTLSSLLNSISAHLHTPFCSTFPIHRAVQDHKEDEKCGYTKWFIDNDMEKLNRRTTTSWY